MQSAIKFDVDVPADHMIRLPEDVPMGRAEIIVLLRPAATTPSRVERARAFLKDCPDQTSDSVDLVREDRNR